MIITYINIPSNILLALYILKLVKIIIENNIITLMLSINKSIYSFFLLFCKNPYILKPVIHSFRFASSDKIIKASFKFSLEASFDGEPSDNLPPSTIAALYFSKKAAFST